MALAHGGLGLLVLGIVAVTAGRQELVSALAPGARATLAGFDVVFVGESLRSGPNYTAESGRFDVGVGGRTAVTLVSEKRTFKPQNQTTTEAGIHTFLSGDLYVVMGDRSADGGRVVRIYFNPLVQMIWLGAAIMFAGGFMSLTDRRFRIGAPKATRQVPIKAAA